MIRCTAQTSNTLWSDLEDLGFDLGDNCSKIVISVTGHEKPVTIMKCLNSFSHVTKKELWHIYAKNGGILLGAEMFTRVKELMQLPDNTSTFEIILEPNEVVITKIVTATPIGSLNFLEDYTHVRREL